MWFFKIPTLRYGGYSASFLILSVLCLILLNGLGYFPKINYKKKFMIIAITMMVIINIKNILRIIEEYKRDDLYKFSQFPYYALPDINYNYKKFDSSLIVYFPKKISHCWGIKTPCTMGEPKLKSKKKYNYFFIYE